MLALSKIVTSNLLSGMIVAKMVHVNGRNMPIEKGFLTSRQMREAAGSVPEQYSLT